jgi:hypothetical protein
MEAISASMFGSPSAEHHPDHSVAFLHSAHFDHDDNQQSG